MNYKEFFHYDFERIPRGGKINARRLELDNRVEVSVFVFSEKPLVFQCILSSDEVSSKLPGISGLHIRYEQYAEGGSKMQNYILLECSHSAYLKQFTEIIKDILAEYDKSNLSMSTCVRQVIDKWRHFFSVPKGNILSEDEIVGLLGELVFLKRLIEESSGESIECWRADQGEDDFIGEHTIVEVKTTLKGRHQHVINGIDQLKPMDRFDKYILSLLLIKAVDGQALSLPSVTDSIAAQLSSSPSCYDAFYEKLKARGYDIRDSGEYAIYSYGYLKGAYFQVNESLPRLSTDSLSLPLSPRISKVRYTIDLEGLPSTDFGGTAPGTPILNRF